MRIDSNLSMLGQYQFLSACWIHQTRMCNTIVQLLWAISLSTVGSPGISFWILTWTWVPKEVSAEWTETEPKFESSMSGCFGSAKSCQWWLASPPTGKHQFSTHFISENQLDAHHWESRWWKFRQGLQASTLHTANSSQPAAASQTRTNRKPGSGPSTGNLKGWLLSLMIRPVEPNHLLLPPSHTKRKRQHGWGFFLTGLVLF
jgi:hypothetical protein